MVAHVITEEINRAVALRQRELYAKRKPATGQKELQWITIGGTPDGDKKHAGGTPVQITKTGQIVKGPKELTGHKVDELGAKTRKANEGKASRQAENTQTESRTESKAEASGSERKPAEVDPQTTTSKHPRDHIRDLLSDGKQRDLHEIRSHMRTEHGIDGKHDHDNPQSHPVNAALKDLAEEGAISVHDPRYGAPSFHMNEEQQNEHGKRTDGVEVRPGGRGTAEDEGSQTDGVLAESASGDAERESAEVHDGADSDDSSDAGDDRPDTADGSTAGVSGENLSEKDEVSDEDTTKTNAAGVPADGSPDAGIPEDRAESGRTQGSSASGERVATAGDAGDGKDGILQSGAEDGSSSGQPADESRAELKGEEPNRPDISEGDVDYKRAYAAHRNTSFSPDKRAKQEQQGFVQFMNSVWDEVSPLAESPGQKQKLVEEFSRFKDGYLKRLHAQLDANSRTASTMITGGSNFPVARNQKRLDTAHKRLTELLEFSEKGQEAIRRNIANAATPEQKQAEKHDAIHGQVDELIRIKKEMEAGKHRGFSPSLAKQNFVGRFETAARHAGPEATISALEHLEKMQSELKKPVFTPRHSIWKMADKAKASIEARKSAPTGTETVHTVGSHRVERDHEDDRVRIYFDGKPDADVRGSLKSAGWRWSPSNGAWQRKNTNASVSSARQILDRHFGQGTPEKYALRREFEQAFAVEREQYAKRKSAPGQKTLKWITLKNDDGGGGTHVQIDGKGQIQKGPAALTGHKVGELGAAKRRENEARANSEHKAEMVARTSNVIGDKPKARPLSATASIGQAMHAMTELGYSVAHKPLRYDLKTKTAWYEVTKPSGDVVPMTADDIRATVKAGAKPKPAPAQAAPAPVNKGNSEHKAETAAKKKPAMKLDETRRNSTKPDTGIPRVPNEEFVSGELAPAKPEEKNDRTYWYGMRLRPPGPGATPRDHSELGEHEDFRHGMIGYAEPLSEKDIYDHDLTPIREAGDIPAVASAVAKKLGRYASRYINDPNQKLLDDRLKKDDMRTIIGHADMGAVKSELQKVVNSSPPTTAPAAPANNDKPKARPLSATASIGQAMHAMTELGYSVAHKPLRYDLKTKTAWYEVTKPSGDVVPMTADDIRATVKAGAKPKPAPTQAAQTPVNNDNPFRAKHEAAQRKADQLAGGTAQEKAMAESFPLGGGFGHGSERSRSKAVDASVDRATQAVEASKQARILKAQADAFDRGEINASGRAVNPNAKPKQPAAPQGRNHGRQIKQGLILKGTHTLEDGTKMSWATNEADAAKPTAIVKFEAPDGSRYQVDTGVFPGTGAAQDGAVNAAKQYLGGKLSPVSESGSKGDSPEPKSESLSDRIEAADPIKRGTQIVDFGPRQRGQGRRIGGGMIVGSGTGHPGMVGKQEYPDSFANVPDYKDLPREQKTMLNNMEPIHVDEYLKARGAGLPHMAAAAWAISDVDDPNRESITQKWIDEAAKQEKRSEVASAPAPFKPAPVPGQQMGLFGQTNSGQGQLFNVAKPGKRDAKAAAQASMLEQIEDSIKKREAEAVPLKGQREMFSRSLTDEINRAVRVERYELRPATEPAKRKRRRQPDKVTAPKKRQPGDGSAGWQRVGGAPVFVNGDGKITKGCPGLKGEHVSDLIDEPDDSRERREVRQTHAKAEGIDGKQYSASDRRRHETKKAQAAHANAKAAAKQHGVATHEVLKEMPAQHEATSFEDRETEAARKRARQMTGLTAGRQAAIENRYEDYSTFPGFDESSRDFASEYPHLFDPDGDDTPAQVWDFIREGKQSAESANSESVAGRAAERLASLRKSVATEIDDALSFGFGGDVPEDDSF